MLDIAKGILQEKGLRGPSASMPANSELPRTPDVGSLKRKLSVCPSCFAVSLLKFPALSPSNLFPQDFHIVLFMEGTLKKPKNRLTRQVALSLKLCNSYSRTTCCLKSVGRIIPSTTNDERYRVCVLKAKRDHRQDIKEWTTLVQT